MISLFTLLRKAISVELGTQFSLVPTAAIQSERSCLISDTPAIYVLTDSVASC